MILHVYIVKGVNYDDTAILDVFFTKKDAEEFIDSYDEESFAFLAIDRREVK